MLPGFNGKILYVDLSSKTNWVESPPDEWYRDYWPTKITSFDQDVRRVLGDKVDEHYRLWWVENSTHARARMFIGFTEDRDPNVWETRLTDFEATSAAALIALKAWVEDAVKPPSNTAYRLTADKELVLAETAAERGGVQPVVRLTVNGGQRAEVKAGTPVTFECFGEVPPGGGTIVETEMDFESKNIWPFKAEGANGTSRSISVKTTYTYKTPGTYFPTLRVGSHRDGATHRGEAVRNLARVRVVVTP